MVDVGLNRTKKILASDIESKLVILCRNEKRGQVERLVFYESSVRLSKRERALLLEMYHRIYVSRIVRHFISIAFAVDGALFVRKGHVWICHIHGCVCQMHWTFFEGYIRFFIKPHSHRHVHSHKTKNDEKNRK